MQTFRIEMYTNNDGVGTDLDNETIDAQLLALPDDNSDDLCIELLKRIRTQLDPTCLLADMLDDAIRGGCTTEERPDMLAADAVQGTRCFIVYFAPDCHYRADYVEGNDCSEGTCNCEGDVASITLTPES